MKKLIYLIVLALILGLVLTGCLLSNVGQVPTSEQSGVAYLTKGIPETIMLYADQDIPVGTVTVSNDDTNLYVTYDTTGGDWVMTETHLAVVTDEDEFPTTKKGNPKVGLFPHQREYDLIDGVKVDTYTISGTWEGGTILYIAAHAVVVDISSIKTETLVSELDVAVYGPLTSYYGLEDEMWGDPPDNAVATWVHGSWPSISGAIWISTNLHTEEPVANNSWRWFHDEINIQGYPLAGTVVSATADNAEEVYFNGVLVGSDGEVQIPFTDNQEWGTILDYSIIPQPGLNTLDFIVRNYAGSSSPTSNPTGLIYKAIISYYPEESAWAGEEPGKIAFSGNNWATYFTYTHDGCYILDITAVNGSTGFTHYFTIDYDPVNEFTGTGIGPSGVETLSDIILADNVISFKSVYTGGYTWYPSFSLNDDGSLTFFDLHGLDNVYSATGTWDISYECNGD